MIPETRYARSGELNLAYQVTGADGPDLVFVPGWVSHVEHAWEEPSYAPFLEGLARFSRLILMDRRGTGLSDPVESLPTIEERMEDLRAVLDAAGSERAFLLGLSEGGPMCSLFAATYPDRTAGLVLANTFARNHPAADYPIGVSEADWRTLQTLVEETWGDGVTARLFAPSRAQDDAFVRTWGRFERRAVSKGAMRKILAMAHDTDIRAVLGSIRVPTLVIHRRDERTVPVACGRYLAEHIAGARLVELPGIDHLPWVGDSAAFLGEIEHFVTGQRAATALDRVLATVLFTDIADSTRQLEQRGDRGWRELLDAFYALQRRNLERFRGREVDTAGDGLFATFDGPARAIRCACATRDGVAALGVQIRAGLHTGECELAGDAVRGIAVHVGARVCGAASPGQVWVSSTVKDLVAGSGLRFEDRGRHCLKGVESEWQLYSVEP